MASLKVGDKAPEFSLPSTDGSIVSLKSLRGKKVVLYFYPKDDTPGCTKEACSFRDNLARVRSKGALIYGVSADSPKSHQKFTEKYDLTFPLLSDESKEMMKAYGVWQQKSFMGKQYDGIIRSHFVIDETGKVVDAQVNVKAKNSPEMAFEALSAE